jgi:hypothetical protein
MSTLTNVFSKQASATGTIYPGATNLGGYQLLSGATAGDYIFRDGGASGPILLQFHISTNATVVSTLLPGNGIRFTTDIHITVPAAAYITIFCG